jgi:hypothetical protein
MSTSFRGKRNEAEKSILIKIDFTDFSIPLCFSRNDEYLNTPLPLTDR